MIKKAFILIVFISFPLSFYYMPAMAQATNNMADFSLVGQWNSHYGDFLNGRPNGREDWRGIIDYAYNGTQVLAKDVSMPLRLKDMRSAWDDPSWPDPYEPDDYFNQARPIMIDFPQDHTFHNYMDIDWVYFFGHKYDIYWIIANDQNGEYSIQMSLYDPNNLFINVSSNYLYFECYQDGYYTIKIQSANPYIWAYNYSLLIEGPCSSPSSSVWGRVVKKINNQIVGINGLKVVFHAETLTSNVHTGSLKNVKNTALDPSVTEGWFFNENIWAPGTYEIQVTELNNPNIIFATSCLEVKENSIYRISDIIINQSYPIQENYEVVSDFELFYSKWQKSMGKEYPIYEDSDNDGLNNQEEFLYGTDPDHTTIKCLLYPGLNIIPFCISDYPYMAGKFCFDKFEEWESILGYNQQSQGWSYWNIKSEGINFPLEEGKGYLIYKHTPEIIFQEGQTSVGLLEPGINLISVFPPPEKEIYSSFQFLKDRRAEGVTSISQCNNNQKDRNKEIGSWQTSYWFFGRPAGSEFTISGNEAYLVEVVEN